jgi:hypothetical protein
MRRVLCALSLLTLAACAEGFKEEPAELPALQPGDSREVELSALRFDVTNFEKRLTRDDLLRLPRDVRERLWLLDLDLSNGPNSPRLLDNALAAIRALDPATLAPAERNMQALLRMTPDTANLAGTSMETLIDLAPLLGVAPEQVLGDLFKRNVEDPFLDDSAIAEAIIHQVIATHPSAQSRLGARTAENADGIYPVAPGTLPVTLTDLATNFETFGKRFGPYDANGASHPGFIGETKASVLTDEFAISVRANANALPYRGVDLTNGSPASVSSIRSQIDDLFDFQDPNWLRVEGLVSGEPSIEALTFRIFEEPSFVKGGLSPYPAGFGASLAWQLSPWRVERVLIGAAQTAFATLDSSLAYAPRGETEPLFSARVEKGFQTISVRGGLGSPPQPAYVWDLLLEVAQVRLHDGGLKEGDANIEFTLRNVRLGTTTSELEAKVKENLRASPSSLLQLTESVLASTHGEADFYYYRAREENAEDTRGDWLMFIVPGDIPSGDDGKPLRAYEYAHPGFYADAALTQKLSSTRALDGDAEHEKVRLGDHPELFVADAAGSVYRVRPGQKPSQNRISLTIERVR